MPVPAAFVLIKNPVKLAQFPANIFIIEFSDNIIQALGRIIGPMVSRPFEQGLAGHAGIVFAAGPAKSGPALFGVVL